MLNDDESTVRGSTALPSDEKQQQEKEEGRPRSDALPLAAADTHYVTTTPSQGGAASFLSKVQAQAVDDAFERIFGYPWGTQFELPAVLNHEQRMLVKIFGPDGAACLFGMLPARTRTRPRRVRPASAVRPIQPRPAGTATTSAQTQMRSILLDPPKRSPSPPKATDPRETDASATSHHAKNAANETLPAPTIPHRGGGSQGVGGGGVDRLLSEISGKPAVSTLSKTSTDWESFKTTSGLGDAIEEKAQSKDSFLNRQDFLSRVDHRRFEVEKQERDRERAQRGV